MLFQSLDYLIFISIVLLCYWPSSQKKRQYILCICALVFYALGSWHYIPLLITSALTDYFCALAIDKNRAKKKYYLFISLFINLGLLFIFKIRARTTTFIPLGISFYTFQTLSYTIDCYRGHYKAQKNFITYFLYVSFFPQLIAGPIERANDLLDQFKEKITFKWHYINQGCLIFLWGLTKKLYVADSLIPITENYYKQEIPSILATYLHGIFITFRIYYDFSGYTDMAIGSALLFGIKLSTNFRPFYLAKDLLSFWRSFWHITLSRWVRDYIYSPIIRNYKIHKIVALFIVFEVISLWHGLTLNWVIFGIINTIIYVIHYFLNQSKKGQIINRASLIFVIPILGVLYYADNVEKLIHVVDSLDNIDIYLPHLYRLFKNAAQYIIPIMAIELFYTIKNEDQYSFINAPLWQKAVFSGACISFISVLSYYQKLQEFLYYQF